MTAWQERALDRGLLPDSVVRAGIRRRLAKRLARERAGGPGMVRERGRSLLAALGSGPIAIETDAANEQHYELPAEFFEAFLGSYLKYSCSIWPAGVATLDDAERAMLDLCVERAGIEDGMDVLDLGCGWGSMSLHIAARFPRCRVLAVSNSKPQRAFIEGRVSERGIGNVEARTGDANTFEPGRVFDRVVSIEMLEHVRNHRAMFARIASWLRPGGRAFVHVFTHRDVAYLFESDDWIGRHFFTGGIMPSDDWFLHIQDDLRVADHWVVGGEQYAKTAEAWLTKFDANRARIDEILRRAYGDEADVWRRRWRIFLMACAEMWGYRGGREWVVSHYLFDRREHGARSTP